jgi:hypothetical protein
MSELRQLAENVWCAEGDLFMPGGIHFPLRMVVVRVEGGLWLHSPIAMSVELIAALRELGEVRWVVAPNLLHHLYVEGALEAFPEAMLYGARGFADKRADLPFVGFLEDSEAYPWGQELLHKVIEGAPGVNECVFFHVASGTLLLTDLVFHINRCANWRSVWMFRLVGVYKKLAQSRLWRFLVKDRAAARESVEALFGWDISRVVMAHGDIVEGADAKARLRRGLHWILGEKKSLRA